MKNQSNLTPETSLRTIHDTMSQAQSAMYLAGTSTILLLWGGVVAVGYLAEFLIANYATDFADNSPWFHAPLWGALVAAGMVASGIIGSRASKQLADPDTARRAGLKVFAFWITVVAAAWVIPALSGIWTSPETAQHTASIAIGIIALGYILFGLMFRLELSVLGIGIAAAHYVPSQLAGDNAYAITAVLILILVVGGALWLRKTGIQ